MSLGRFLLRRAVFALLLTVVASSAALLLTLMTPGDFAADGTFGDPELMAARRKQLGLDRPVLTQYADWVGRAIRLDFGESLLYSRPVADLLGERALNTAVLATAALGAATLFGIPLGIYTGARQRGLGVSLVRALSMVMLSMPPLIASLAMVLFAARTGWFPVGGMVSAGASELSWARWMADMAHHIPLPALALALPLAATLERLQSQAMGDAIRQPFVRAAEARGLSPDQAMLKHAWRVSLGAVLGLYGLMIGSLLSGSFIVEVVTAWPGLGRLMYDALRARDLYLVAGCAAAGAFFLAIGTFLADVMLAAADPARPHGHAAVTRRIGILLGVLIVITVVAPWIAPYNPETQHRGYLFAPPMRPHLVDNGALRAPFVYSIELTDRLSQRYDEDRTRPRPLPWFGASGAEPVFLFGADSYGRDLLSRLLHGARLSLSLALVSVLGALVIGAAIGGLAGYRGGWLDEAAMRAVDFVIVLPVIYVALVLRAMLPLALAPSTVFVMMAGIFVLVGWPFVARGVRGIVAAERDREYVVAARSLGAGTGRIVGRHLLPACTGYLLVQATLLLPAFILGEATLSYVGLGFPEHIATWGTMLIEAANPNAMQRFPWTLAPAVAIFLLVLVANVVLQSDKIASNLLRRV